MSDSIMIRNVIFQFQSWNGQDKEQQVSHFDKQTGINKILATLKKKRYVPLNMLIKCSFTYT